MSLKFFRKLAPNFYRSAAPSPEDVKWLRDKFGIQRILSFDEAAAASISKACELLDIEQVVIPVSFGSKASLVAMLSKIDAAFDSEKKTLAHCKHGKDRLGLVCALYRCKVQGWSPEKAIKEADSFAFCVGLSPEISKLYHDIILKCKGDEDVMEVYDFDYGQGYASYPFPGMEASQNLSWAPYDRSNLFFPGSSTATPREIELAELGDGGVVEWQESDGHEVSGMPQVRGPSSSTGLPGAGFSFPGVRYTI